MEEKRNRRELIGITIIGILLGSILMIYIPGRSTETVLIQENRFPEQIKDMPGVTSHQFNLGLLARRNLDRVEVRYSFLTLDTSLNLSKLNQGSLRRENLSDTINEISWLLDATEDYPASPVILDTHLVLGEEEYDARVYDFTGFFPFSASSNFAGEALTAFLVLFDDGGEILHFFKGISDFVDEWGTGLKLKSVTVLRAPEKEMYYAGDFTDEDIRPIEERPWMGVVRFNDVDKASTLGVIFDAEHNEGGRAKCLQLIRIYVNGKIEEIAANQITLFG